VVFTRDSSGRIKQITDPDGNPAIYSYSSAGDLSSYTDRAKNTTTYSYSSDGKHNLTGITTPDGKQALTNSYDPTTGRLTGTTDGMNNSVSFSPPNFSNNTQTVTDRLGNPTTYTYDADGNVTQVVDARQDGHKSILANAGQNQHLRISLLNPRSNSFTIFWRLTR
jgi:YD repeat-containing protein